MMKHYTHRIVLKYDTFEQFNRHAARIIEREGFMSGGIQCTGTYMFFRDINSHEYQQLLRSEHRDAIDNGNEHIVQEHRIAW